MKFITMCDGGNVRSAAMAYELKLRGHEAFAIGRKCFSQESIGELAEWADNIILMMPHMIESVPKEYRNKALFVDVGEDTYGHPLHDSLKAQCKNGADWLMDYIKVRKDV